MDIAIIGAGNVGRALAGATARAAHAVAVRSAGREGGSARRKGGRRPRGGIDRAAVEEPAAEQIHARVAGARVVKAFFASRLAEPVVDGVPLDGLVAGDDDAAKRTVLELVEELGLRPIDAGPITMARALEWMAFLNISLQIRNDWSWQTGWKLIGPTGSAA